MNAPAYRINGTPATREAFYALACDPARSIAVEACAGAGKTWMLVSRILRALLDGCAPQDILAITFTKKAAGEMRDRLNTELRRWASLTDEALAGDYRFRVECLAPDDGIELKSLLGLPVRLGIAGADGSESLRCGVVSAAETLGSDGGFAKYALTVEPPFALLRLRHTSRVFQDLSVDAIVRQLFAEHAAANPLFAAVQSLDFALSGPLPTRSYCLQYRESDHDFISRLLREEGLSWRYEHLDGDTPQVKLLAFDDPYSLPAANVARVRFHRSDATEDEDGLTRWDGARQIVPGSVALAL